MSIGDTLADARRQAGLTITQVSQRTRIRESIIAAIEQDDFSACGGDFYARGHIRSIASVVGTDPAPLIREYDQEHGPPTAMRASRVFEPVTPIRIREPSRFPLGRVLAVLLLAVIGYGAYWFVSRHDTHDTAASTSSSTSTLHPTTAPSHTVHPTVTPTPTHASGAPEAVIRLTAREDCWVGITSASGKQLFQGIVPAGNTMTWREKHPVSMVIGNTPAISLTVNGKNETPNSVQVVTVRIVPAVNTEVSMTAPSGPVSAVGAPSPGT